MKLYKVISQCKIVQGVISQCEIVAPLPCPPGLLLTQPDKNIAVVKRCFKLGNSMCQSSYDKPNIKPGKIGIGVSLGLPKFVKFKKTVLSGCKFQQFRVKVWQCLGKTLKM